MHLNVGLNAYSFDLLSGNNFSKWIKFKHGETCVDDYTYIGDYIYMGDYTCLCCDDIEPKYLESKKH